MSTKTVFYILKRVIIVGVLLLISSKLLPSYWKNVLRQILYMPGRYAV
jgi:hypothetical protein